MQLRRESVFIERSSGLMLRYPERSSLIPVFGTMWIEFDLLWLFSKLELALQRFKGRQILLAIVLSLVFKSTTYKGSSLKRYWFVEFKGNKLTSVYNPRFLFKWLRTGLSRFCNGKENSVRDWSSIYFIALLVGLFPNSVVGRTHNCVV